MPKGTDAIRQLEELIKRYPQYTVDIEGVILDYQSRTSSNIDDVLRLRFPIYEELFLGESADAGRRVLEAQVSGIDDIAELKAACQKPFPQVCTVLDEIESALRAPVSTVSAAPTDFFAVVGHNADVVIWHISDIHFGHLNKVEQRPEDLAAILAKIVVRYKAAKPSLIIFSGDATSISADEEYDDFVRFCRSLCAKAEMDISPSRLLVIPGNHDVTWLPNGCADRLERFRAKITSANCCITPFGPESETFEGGRVTVKRQNIDNDLSPPVAVVTYEDLKLQCILMVSSYYSGDVPEKVRHKLRGRTAVEDLFDLIRYDEGELGSQLLLELERLHPDDSKLTLGVVHHNPRQYGADTCCMKHAPALLGLLHRKKVSFLLHGHTHLYADERINPVLKHQAHTLPAPTLCSIASSGSARGMCVYLVDNHTTPKSLTSLYWEMSASNFLDDGRVQILSTFQVADGKVKSSHRQPDGAPPEFLRL